MDQSTISDEIKKYVSNIDKDIYTVNNIPEEVVAVIFAYVSRSSKGFRENIYVVIKEEQLGKERASKFHEKWVLNYGHASVAEHAAVHMGVERVSRLFSSINKLADKKFLRPHFRLLLKSLFCGPSYSKRSYRARKRLLPEITALQYR